MTLDATITWKNNLPIYATKKIKKLQHNSMRELKTHRTFLENKKQSFTLAANKLNVITVHDNLDTVEI